MGFNPPVPQNDSDWEIRVAVLVSLMLQVLLIFVGSMRKRSSHPFPRFLVWSCYLLADWVADLALGLMLNNMGNIGGGGNSSSNSFGSSNKRSGGGGTTIGSDSSTSPMIFAFWTPFLLLHLGGPDTITAYSLEDNELWLRHLIGLLFELFSALVIFSCSIHNNPMIPATVLMFVVGIIKYGERTYSLYSGSIERFRANIAYPPEPGPNYAKLMTEFGAKQKAGLVVKIDIANGIDTREQQEAQREEIEHLVLKTDKSIEARAYGFFLIFRRLFVFVSLILSFREQQLSQAFFLSSGNNHEEAFEVIEVELNYIYDMVYTKAPVAHLKVGWMLRLLCSGCLIASLFIFFFLHKAKHGISCIDVGITYALLLGGMALDASALLMLLFSNRAKVYLESSSIRFLQWLARLRRMLELRHWKMCQKNWLIGLLLRRWAGKTSQLNLISYCIYKPDYYPKRNRWWLLNTMAKTLGAEAIVDDLVFLERHAVDPPSKEGNGLMDFIFIGLKELLKVSKDQANEKLKELCNSRGDYVINMNKELILEALDKTLNVHKYRLAIPSMPTSAFSESKEDDVFSVIEDSVDRNETELDESVLLWHIATDLCLLRAVHCPLDKIQWMRSIAKTLSEYMLYLLIMQPEMLSAKASIGLLRYWDTCAELRRFLGPLAAALWSHYPDDMQEFERDARNMLLQVNTSEKPSRIKGRRSRSVLFDAVILAKALRAVGDADEELMWTVIAGVWREMLTFAAGKCMGSTHVHQLSHGGQLITLVWFLMAHMGLGGMYNIEEDAKAKLIIIDQ